MFQESHIFPGKAVYLVGSCERRSGGVLGTFTGEPFGLGGEQKKSDFTIKIRKLCLIVKVGNWEEIP